MVFRIIRGRSDLPHIQEFLHGTPRFMIDLSVKRPTPTREAYLGPLVEILEIKTEDVVSGDKVRIHLLNLLDPGHNQVGFSLTSLHLYPILI